MIIEYHRPQTLDAALGLLSRTEPPTRPLGGGTILNRPGYEKFAVVDLQALGLNQIEVQGNQVSIGATATLQQLAHSPEIPTILQEAFHQETTANLRQMGTIAGTLVSANGRSLLTAVLMALDTRLIWAPNDKEVSLGDWLALRRENSGGLLITQVVVPLKAQVAFASVARTPADQPLVCAAVAHWPSGRTRLTLGGTGKTPVLAMDGPNPAGAEIAAREAYHEAGDDWASAEYRQDVAARLVRRCLNQLEVL